MLSSPCLMLPQQFHRPALQCFCQHDQLHRRHLTQQCLDQVRDEWQHGFPCSSHDARKGAPSCLADDRKLIQLAKSLAQNANIRKTLMISLPPLTCSLTASSPRNTASFLALKIFLELASITSASLLRRRKFGSGTTSANERLNHAGPR